LLLKIKKKKKNFFKRKKIKYSYIIYIYIYILLTLSELGIPIGLLLPSRPMTIFQGFPFTRFLPPNLETFNLRLCLFGPNRPSSYFPPKRERNGILFPFLIGKSVFFFFFFFFFFFLLHWWWFGLLKNCCFICSIGSLFFQILIKP